MKTNNQIVFLIPSFSTGGAERNVIHVANKLSKEGVNIQFIVINSSGELRNTLNTDINVISLNSSRMSMAIPKLTRLLNKDRPEVIMSTLTQASLALMIARFFLDYKPKIILRVECVLSKMINDEKHNNIFFHLFPLLIRHLFKQANWLIAISKGVKEDLETTFGIKRDIIRVIYNPAIPENLTELAQQQVDHEWYANKILPVIIAVGRLTKQKSFDTLIKAFERVNLKCKARLVILGDGPERKRLEQMTEELKISESVWMPGIVQNPYKYIKKSDVFVLSSVYEGFGNVLAEALACKISIVSTDCKSGPAEILNYGKYGRLVTVLDHTAMSDAILQALNDKTYVIDDVWLEHFTVNTVSSQYYKLLRTDGTTS